MKIVGHCLVKNEEKFIWYAITSVIDFLDELIVWDNGSTDKTINIIKAIKNPKIKFREVTGSVEKLRQQMLQESKDANWIFILDGDEIWHEQSINNLKFIINNSKSIEVIVSPNYMLIGDIYHYQQEQAGRYRIGNRTGHLNIRAFKNTTGLHIEGVYPNEAYVTQEGIKLQDLPSEKIVFSNEKYLHASFLKRSDKDTRKIKYEIGDNFPKDFYYPEVFFKSKPSNISTPWILPNWKYKLVANLQTPLKKFRRRFI